MRFTCLVTLGTLFTKWFFGTSGKHPLPGKKRNETPIDFSEQALYLYRVFQKKEILAQTVFAVEDA